MGWKSKEESIRMREEKVEGTIKPYRVVGLYVKGSKELLIVPRQKRHKMRFVFWEYGLVCSVKHWKGLWWSSM